MLFGIPHRQTTGPVAGLLQLIGLNWTVSDYGTPFRRQKTLNVSKSCHPGTGVLHLLIDATGIKATREGE